VSSWSRLLGITTAAIAGVEWQLWQLRVCSYYSYSFSGWPRKAEQPTTSQRRRGQMQVEINQNK
jgi:hypothetical protein